MSTAAQDEFNELFRDKDRSSKHPEDEGSSLETSDVEDTTKEQYYERDDLDELDTYQPDNMRSRYFLPRQVSEANTGPKGVIADAQAFEQAKKSQRFSLFRSSKDSEKVADEKLEDREDEDGFLARWRANRLKELQKPDTRQKSRSRTRSPPARRYGSLISVDGEGYLDAIENSPSSTVVVVYIYDDLSDISDMVEDCLRELVRKHLTTRFVKLHFEDAEMEPAGVPAIIAYKAGDRIASLVPIVDEIPDDAELSATSLEAVMKRYVLLVIGTVIHTN
ncbi:thioredoxin-like protein [Patellaria atrata CBS 101060]|uniref:Thioredoxin-like protein n=1 Tax=Patellaria atrata CBS 101060 TaxID=1346257 RepID=A0A9P4S8U0_9PEZI|nr:thioredoxin-like protein [Patellaria atrata CBS 101060]